MKPSTALPIGKTKYICIIFALTTLLLGVVSLFTGKYPLSLDAILSGNELHRQVFISLRLSRTVVALIGGFALGVSGFVYQTVFKNPLASPDIIGVSSGASMGAAAGILFLSSPHLTTISAFLGALLAVGVALGLSHLDKSGKNSTIVLSGIATHSIAQTILMGLKLTADPEKELASIEYWIMGSLGGVSIYNSVPNLFLMVITLIALFLLYRQIILLSTDEGEGRMLGADVSLLRIVVLITSTLCVSSVISLTGLISFIGLLAPHIARLILKINRLSAMLLSGFLGAGLLCGADILTRCTPTELPVSIFTSLIGAPFLIFLVIKGRDIK